MILVDSDVLITHLRGHEIAREWLLDVRRRTGPLAVSVVTIAEITGGMRSGERSDVTRLLGPLLPLAVDARVAWRAGEQRRSYHRSHQGIGIADHLIAATARVHGCELATLDVRHVPTVEGRAATFAP